MIISDLIECDLVRGAIVNKIEENSASVDIDVEYFSGDEIDLEKMLNLAVDDYYKALKLGNTPKAIDNLVLINRGNNKFSIYLIELKDVNKLRRLCVDDIKEKYQTTINDFMINRYGESFNNDAYKLIDFNIWLVCNKFRFLDSDISSEDYEKKIENTFIERLLMIKPFKYKNKLSQITPMYPRAQID
ncbi:hypothetical protein RV034_000687 [Vibrio parahaemolyticus]|nr:hypothetical protein [Vibrio parahaemolyticus]